MLSDRIETLFALLKCNNTDIAHWAGCSPGNISKLKRGHRIPRPDSRSILTFAEGVYGYADYENMLTIIQELCGRAERNREVLIPALIAWLYDTEDMILPDKDVQPKSKRIKSLQRKSFGDKLNQVMDLVNLSNGQLASLLKVDSSLISRYRSGLHSPHNNRDLSQKLSDLLFSRAVKSGKTSELAALCGYEKEMPARKGDGPGSNPGDGKTAGIDAKVLNSEMFFEWLYRNEESIESSLAEMLLASLNDFRPDNKFAGVSLDLPAIEHAPCYWGTEGLRKAVIRFLNEAAEKGGELFLYSDEPMDWMTADPAYFSLWASLMVKCVRNGVKIKIIHNVDRVGKEMISAIKGWFPLYISGMIEPYVFSRSKNPRFNHTVFLHEGNACIHGFFPLGGGQERCYDYITDPRRLKALKTEYDSMLFSAIPFLKVFPPEAVADYSGFCSHHKGMTGYLLTAPPIATMPEKLFNSILDRADPKERKRLSVERQYRSMRKHFLETLKTGSHHMILMPPAKELARQINFSLNLLDIKLDYTPEEYKEHMKALASLVDEEQNFHLTLLPEAPFSDIQLVVFTDSVVVLRSREPYCAFAFLNPHATKAVAEYLSVLIEENHRDRTYTIERLSALL